MDSLRLDSLLAIPVSARFATADHLGQVYLISEQNFFEKYSPEGRLLARFSQNRLGAATFADVSNPLKIILFYSDFRVAVLLDRNLVELGRLDFEALGLPMIRLVASSQDGNLWVYDEVNFQLKKVAAADGSVLFESPPMNFLAARAPARTVSLFESGNSVFLVDGEQGVFQFDFFGQFLRLVLASGLPPDLIFWEGRLRFLDKDRAKFLDLATGEVFEKTCPTMLKNVENRWRQAGDYLLETRKNIVIVWRIQK